jgi:FkbM family methyltransferase
MKKTLLEIAYKIEVLASRCQGIAGERPQWNGEYSVVARLGPAIRHAIDGGANLGEWTANLLTHAPQARVLLAEPHPENAKYLRQKFASQGSQVNVQQVALAAEPGHVFLAADTAMGTGSGITTKDSTARGWKVPATNLPMLAQEFGSDCEIDFVKLDIEGDEMAVVTGARKLFESGRLGIVQLEYNCTWIDKQALLGDLFKFAREVDYQLFQLTPFGAMSLPGYGIGLEDFRLRNILLVRPVLVSKLAPFPAAGRARVEAFRQSLA